MTGARLVAGSVRRRPAISVAVRGGSAEIILWHNAAAQPGEASSKSNCNTES